jgi:hypothetical protein
MAENEKKPRSVSEIQGEYASLCTRAGDLQYRIFTFTKDLELLNQTLKDLNFEAAASRAAEVKAKAKADEEAKAKDAGIASVTPIAEGAKS